MIHTLAKNFIRIPCFLTQGIHDFAEQQNFKKKALLGDDDIIHLKRTINWLARAHDIMGRKGISIYYDRQKKWCPDPYPETSGYIIATFLKFAQLSNDRTFIDRAIDLGNWEIHIQHPSGGVVSSIHNNVLRIFNTGQVILGWCSLFEETKNEQYLTAALHAGDYLIAKQESNGSWIQDTYCGARTYHARASWSLMRLAQISGQEKYFTAGLKNILWVLAQQTETGWFKNCGFNSNPPITHVLGYTVRGLLECQQLIKQNSWPGPSWKLLSAVLRTCQSIVKTIEQNKLFGISGMLPAAFDENWQPRYHSSCLTGNAQIAVCLMRLGQVTKADSYFKMASVLIDTLKMVQKYEARIDETGGLAGSFPFYGFYEPGRFPNWAAKFMADSLIMKIKYTDKWWVNA